jgi:hypothetical protein
MPNALPLSEHLYFHPKLNYSPVTQRIFLCIESHHFVKKKLKMISMTNTLSKEKITKKGKIKICQKSLQLPTT